MKFPPETRQTTDEMLEEARQYEEAYQAAAGNRMIMDRDGRLITVGYEGCGAKHWAQICRWESTMERTRVSYARVHGLHWADGSWSRERGEQCVCGKYHKGNTR